MGHVKELDILSNSFFDTHKIFLFLALYRLLQLPINYF
jgi:hypothetical protein